MRVAIAEDHGIFRTALQRVLEESGNTVIASTRSGEELLERIEGDVPDVVILDISMPPTFTDEGITTAVQLRDCYPELGILILSAHSESAFASTLFEKVKSRFGYVLKDQVTDESTLLDVIARLAAGEDVIDSTIVSRLVEHNRGKQDLSNLSERERTVLQYLAEGRSNLGIARQLKISSRTVEVHIASIFSKLDLPSKPEENNRVLAVLKWLRSQDSHERSTATPIGPDPKSRRDKP